MKMTNLFAFAFGLTFAAGVAACGAEASPVPSTSSAPSATVPTPSGDDAPSASASSPSPSSSTGTPAPSSSTTTPAPSAVSCASMSAQPLDQTITMTWKGATRTAMLHVPASYDHTKPTPLVLNFHGYLGSPDNQQSTTHMNAKSDEKGFIAVHPGGLDSSWDAGACCGNSASAGVDDVGFVNALLDKLESQLCVDTKRVFSTGMSNGGFLSHRLGCELSDRIAAIVPVAGLVGIPTCNPKRPVPVMQFHGTADPLVPYGGNALISYPPVADTIAGWVQRNGCTDASPAETYKNGDVTCVTYSQCSAGAEVTLCTVDGGGHQWPGGEPLPLLGKTTNDISATDAGWEFFAKHAMP